MPFHHVRVHDVFSGFSVRAVELFCGAGGMSRGLIDAGIDVVQAYDAWPVAVENYRHNIGPHAEVADLKNILSIVPAITRLEPDMICGGPPCQDYSLAGRRQEGENASMTIAFAIIATVVRPEWIVMENVVQAANSQAWADARAMLKRAGYGLSESRANASLYGVPQSRRRFILIARLGERDGFLRSAIADAASAQPMTLRDMFGIVVERPSCFHATSAVRRSVYSPNESAPTVRERSIRSVPATSYPHAADIALIENGYVYSRPVRGGRGVRSIDEPFPTVTRTSWERPGPKYLSNPHPDDPAPAALTAALTREQASRIQGFPEDWQWTARAQRDVLQMIANAVPAPLAKAVGEVILARHRGVTSPAIEGRFLDWLVRNGHRRAIARNIKASAMRARRLLGGRTYADSARELADLDVVAGFGELPKNTRSDLRRALVLLTEFEVSKKSRSKRTFPLASIAATRETLELANAA
ncbi:DNA cytosine methyltransferase [Rhizobium leguminosarum]|uniref:DNA cytosine methyltransferase n=1 Tax=Rhizobium TaxID=379 RepID=UPI00103F98BA|nr:DNA cytosine methyltransferase [Rhizobium leguminosarum]TCA72255.1 DNA cytosine methyltransferase [Rhizobium leguminosarum bv. viciae]